MKPATILVGVLSLAGLLLVALGHGATGPTLAAGAGTEGQAPTAGDRYEPVLGMPATKVVVLGSSPGEASGGVWAYGTLGDAPALVDGVQYADQLTLLERTGASGWQVVPLPRSPDGGSLGSGLDEGSVPYLLGALGGRVTSAGGIVLLTQGGIVMRDPGGMPVLAPDPPNELLESEESFPPAEPHSSQNTPFAAIEEEDGHVGLLIAPYNDGQGTGNAGEGILHYAGTGERTGWSRERISGASTSEPLFAPESLACGGTSEIADASSPDNCWLLAAYRSDTTGSEPNRLALFRRMAVTSKPGEYVWEQQQVADWMLGEGAPPSGVDGPVSVSPLSPGGQMLTITPQGAWVDFSVKIGSTGVATDVSQLIVPDQPRATAESTGTWCFGTADPGCDHTLEDRLPARYRSFASPGASPSDPGTRVITGLPDGAMLQLSGAGPFAYMVGPGGSGGGVSGAAFDLTRLGSVEEGFIGEGSPGASDDQGQSQLVDVTPRPEGNRFQESPVPFRHPLLALAQVPGTTPGDSEAEAVAVGADGEIGRYVPGQGWSPETLYNSAGAAQVPTLRGVAWPETGRAYAVGNEGAMWLWRRETGLWEPDPATPYNFIGNLTGIAFSPSDPEVGYAVGKQGVLLRYGKTWEEISPTERVRLESELKVEEQRLNFTSIAFAGGQALATYRIVEEDQTRGERVEAGGLLVEDGSGWHVDSSVSSLLAELPSVRDTVLSKVAGLPDGGAVAAGPGIVIERNSVASAWHFSAQPLPEAQNVSALAAYRDGSGAVRSIASIDLDAHMNPNFVLAPGEGAFAGDLAPPGGTGQPPAHLPPDPLPDTGYVLQETASGWDDMEHMALESPSGEDMPVRPDPVMALDVAPDGSSGFAVGGQTNDTTGSTPSPDPFETAAAMRFGGGVPAGGEDKPATILTTTGTATFAVGGGAACEQACSDFAQEGLAPDALLSHALQMSNQIATTSPGGLRGFLYTGDRLLAKSLSLGTEAFGRELERYAGLLGGAGALPVHVAASPNDLSPSGGIGPFAQALGPFAPGGNNAYYSFTSEGASGGKVVVIVLDYSRGSLETPGVPEPNAQDEWLERELEAAREHGTPAIVMGNASLGFTLPKAIGLDPPPVQAEDAATVSKILVEGEASAYLFDYPGANVATHVSFGAKHISAFGTGTLGYASPPGTDQTDSLGSSGFLLLEVNTAQRLPGTENVAPVNARVEPNIGELALDATDGALLRRSQVALFDGLARVPPSGRAISAQASGAVTILGPAPYEPIPFDCLGTNCVDQIPTDYTFTSSNPDIGNFVAHEASSNEPRQVELGTNRLPIPDPHSGLFCAYNQGTTIVSINAGGLTYTEPVTVQGGSVEYPCGTVPLKNPPPQTAPAERGFTLPNLTPNATPGNPFSPLLTLPVPVLLAARPHHPHHHRAPVPAALFVPVVGGLVQLPPAIVPPAPAAAQPSPPSGTSSAQVYQSAVAPESEREEEGAIDMVQSFAGYTHDASPLAPRYLPLLILLLAFMGSRIFRAWRPDRREAEAIAIQRLD